MSSMGPRLLGVSFALFLMPWAVPKMIAITLLVCGAATWLNRERVVESAAIRRTALAIGLCALVITPLWSVAPTFGSRCAGLIGCILTVVAWGAAAPSEIRLRGGAPDSALWTSGVAVAMLVGPNIFGAIEFRGDEDVLVTRPLRALEALNSIPAGVGVAIVLLLGVLALVARRAPWRLAGLADFAVVSAATLSAIWFAVRPLSEDMQLRLTRYPPLGAWIQTVLAQSPLVALTRLPDVVHSEALYRLSSFAAVLIFSLIAARCSGGNVPFRVATGLWIATTPSVLYFSTTAYTDFLGSALVTAALAAAHVWLARRRATGSYGAQGAFLLGTAVLVKESFAPLAAGLAGSMAGGVVAWRRRSFSSSARDALRIAFVILGPLSVYVFWRLLSERLLRGGRSMRGFGMDLGALANPEWASLIGLSWWQQFGWLPAAAALALWFRGRRANTLLLIPGALVQMFVLNVEFVVETPGGTLPMYTGFARYQLTLLPLFAWLGILGVRMLWKRLPVVAWAVVLVGLASNFALRPVHADGSRAPFWGDSVQETSGERYPYDALYEWFAEQDERRPILIADRDYSYPDEFYRRRTGLQATVTAPMAPSLRSTFVVRGGPSVSVIRAAMDRAIAASNQWEGPIVLHVNPWFPATDPAAGFNGLRFVREFRLGAKRLWVYEREATVGAPVPRGIRP